MNEITVIPVLQVRCPVASDCAWRASNDDAKYDAIRAHVAAEHPELLEPDPIKVGRLWTRDLWMTYEAVQ